MFCLIIFISCLCSLSYQSSNVAPPTSISLTSINVQLSETEKTKLDLNGGPLVECQDEDPTRAYIKTISPTSPCGVKCFMLERCGPTNETDFCLFFLPTEGTLNYQQASSYKLTIGCTDDVEPVATKDMTVTIVSNSPPLFSPTLPSTATIPGTTTGAGKSLFSVAATDPDNDPIYYTMNLSPNTPYLSIGANDGIVQSTHDLRYLCESSVTATFRATDNINPAVTKTVVFSINPHNSAPLISNLDATVNINENIGAGIKVWAPTMVDDGVGSTLAFHVTSVSGSGLEQYTWDNVKRQISTQINPNYERLDTRSVTLYLDVTDGYCSSPQYSLTINILDVDEPPALVPATNKQVDVYEGNVNTPTGIALVDEDIGDTWTYSLASSSPSGFTVEPNSGYIISTAPIDIDPNTPQKTYVIKYYAKDNRGNVSNTATVTLTVHDINDNVPVFNQKSYAIAATECSQLGSVLGKVSGTDLDSIYRSNKLLVYGGGGSKMAVMSNGDVVLTQACVDGETGTGEATITDQGEYPNPLEGLTASLDFKCGPCPPPPPPVTAAPATTAKSGVTTSKTGAGASGSGTGNTKGGIDDYLGWMIPAIIGGTVWLALMGYLIYRFCFPCRNPCAGRCVRQPSAPKPPPKAPEPKPPKPQAPKKMPQPPKPEPKVDPPPPPPPPPPQPKADPYLFGFWKEQYTDQDLMNQPVRAAKPAPIEHMPPAEVIPRGNAIPPENLKLGNPGIGQWNPNPVNNGSNGVPTITQNAPPKKSTCTIS